MPYDDEDIDETDRIGWIITGTNADSQPEMAWRCACGTSWWFLKWHRKCDELLQDPVRCEELNNDSRFVSHTSEEWDS